MNSLVIYGVLLISFNFVSHLYLSVLTWLHIAIYSVFDEFHIQSYLRGYWISECMCICICICMYVCKYGCCICRVNQEQLCHTSSRYVIFIECITCVLSSELYKCDAFQKDWVWVGGRRGCQLQFLYICRQ
jgi:hypothetical protein